MTGEIKAQMTCDTCAQMRAYLETQIDALSVSLKHDEFFCARDDMRRRKALLEDLLSRTATPSGEGE